MRFFVSFWLPQDQHIFSCWTFPPVVCNSLSRRPENGHFFGLILVHSQVPRAPFPWVVSSLGSVDSSIQVGGPRFSWGTPTQGGLCGPCTAEGWAGRRRHGRAAVGVARRWGSPAGGHTGLGAGGAGAAAAPPPAGCLGLAGPQLSGTRVGVALRVQN